MVHNSNTSLSNCLMILPLLHRDFPAESSGSSHHCSSGSWSSNNFQYLICWQELAYSNEEGPSGVMGISRASHGGQFLGPPKRLPTDPEHLFKVIEVGMNKLGDLSQKFSVDSVSARGKLAEPHHLEAPVFVSGNAFGKERVFIRKERVFAHEQLDGLK